MSFPAFDLTPAEEYTKLILRHFTGVTTEAAAAVPPHTHNYYSLSILLQGTTTYYAEPTSVQVEAPAILLLDKNQVHVHGPHYEAEILAVSFVEWVMSASGQVNEDWQQLFSMPVISLSDAELAKLRPYLTLLQTEYQLDQPRNSAALTRHLLAIVLQLTREFQRVRAGRAAPASPGLHQAFSQLLNAQYRHVTGVRDYAEQLHVSPDQLQQAVQAATGKSPKQLIDERLLMEAKRLLYWAQLPAKEIAWQLGFANAQYFSRFFKKHTGYTPLGFRALMAQPDN